MVQQWAQFRYGVFEEHGFPNDDMLPYFYRHPNGFDAVSTSNDSVIVGDLERCPVYIGLKSIDSQLVTNDWQFVRWWQL